MRNEYITLFFVALICGFATESVVDAATAPLTTLYNFWKAQSNNDASHTTSDVNKGYKSANEYLIKKEQVVDYGGVDETYTAPTHHDYSHNTATDQKQELSEESEDASVDCTDSAVRLKGLSGEPLAKRNSDTKEDNQAKAKAEEETGREQEEERRRKEEEEANREVSQEEYGIKVQNEMIKIIEEMEPGQMKQDLINEKISDQVKLGFDRMYADDWEFYSKFNSGATLETKLVNGYTIYRAKVTLDVPVKKVLEVLYDKFELQPKWNKSYTKCQIIGKINKDTDVTYREVVLPLTPGSWDYVLFRHRSRSGKVVMFVQLSMDCHCDPMLNKNKTPTRAYIGPSVSVLEPAGEKSEKCSLMVLLDSDLKGRIGRNIPNWLISHVQSKYMKNLNEYLKSLLPK